MIALLLALMTQSTEPATPLQQTEALVADLQCDAAAPAVAALQADADPHIRQVGLFLDAYCRAVDGSTSGAAAAYRDAWRIDLAAALPFAVEPKVQVLVDAARAEVLSEIAAEQARARAALVASIHLRLDDDASHVAELRGGERVQFVLRVDDPHGAVRSLRVEFKQGADPEFYALPLRRGKGDTWHGEIPGQYTRTPTGAVQLFWLITASDADGAPLASLGTRDKPNAVYVQKGSEVAQLPARERLPHAQRLLFAGAGLPAAGALAATSSALGLAVLGAIPPLQSAIQDRGAFTQVALVAIAVVPTMVGGAAVYACASVLLDGWQAWVPAATFVAALSLSGLASFVVANGLLAVPKSNLGDSKEERQDAEAQYRATASSALAVAAILQVGASVLVTLLVGAPAALLVAIDGPGYE